MANFAGRMKQLRQEHNMSQEELAERCGYTNKSTVSRIESGDRDIPVRQLKKIAAALGMSMEDLVVETYQSEIENKPRQKDAEEILNIIEKRPELSRALLRYAQYLAKQEDT